jgi:two-component system CheB/CheR fusion protein
LRIRPYRTSENKIDGAVLLLVDIDEHKRAIEEVMTMVNQPLVALDGDLRVKKANAKFYATFRVEPDETEHRFIYDLGKGQWNIPQLRALLEDVLPKDQRVNDYRVEAQFPDLGPRVMSLNARKFYEEGRGQPLVLLSIDDVTDAAGKV